MEPFYGSRCSLYSGNSLSTDDLNWSLQPNYVKMMNDTNLIDSCAAATDDMEPVRGRMTLEQTRKHFEFLERNNFKTQQASVDAEQLEQWIVYMDKYLKAFAPNWKQVVQMDSHQRIECFDEQYKLRQYIASHHNVFNQMIREDDSKRTRKVENMYHELLLNAIEKQCLVEQSLQPEGKLKRSPCVDSHIQLNQIITKSNESLFVGSDFGTTVPSDDGIHFSTHPTTSKSSSFSGAQCSPFSLHSDFERDEDYQSWESIIQELQNIDIDNEVELLQDAPNLNSLISENSLELIKNVDQVVSTTPNSENLYMDKVDNWLQNQHSVVEANIDSSSDESASSSELGSAISCQWDNYQDIYISTTPMHEDTPSNEFLFFGDDYDDALKSKHDSSSSSTSGMQKSRTTEQLSIGSRISAKGSSETVNETLLKNGTDSMPPGATKDQEIQTDAVSNNSQMANDILTLVENLQKNYMNLTPRDFDGVLQMCRDNLGCLLVVLDRNHSHYDATTIDGVDALKTPETCQCGIISRFFARIVEFLHGCSRKVRRSAMYKFLLKVLKRFYAMVKFLTRQVRFYRALYGSTV